MTATPPKISSCANFSPANQFGWFVGIVAAGVLPGIAAIVYFFDPSQNHFYPVCQFHKLTGWNCPGCGATRALFALLHGQFQTALHDNALFVLALPVVILRAVWFYGKRFLASGVQEMEPRKFFPTKMIVLGIFVAVIFSVLRNLPAFAFLSP